MKEYVGSTESCVLTPPTSPAASNRDAPLPTPILDDATTTSTPTSPSPKHNRKKRDGTSLRKAPQAPKRFKSSYILFFMEKQEEIKSQLPKGSSVGDVSKKSSELWKKLSPEERAHWDARAEKDKERFMLEKAAYTGPWQIPWKRAKKDPSAPKRPMSAFLYFSQDRRGSLKTANPTMRNTEISSILGKLWRDASDEDRRPYVERELFDRNKYKAVLATWKKADKVRKEAEREEKWRREKEEEKERERLAEERLVRAERERMEWPADYHVQGYYYGHNGGRGGDLPSPMSPHMQPGECYSPYTGGYPSGLQQRGQQVQGYDMGIYNPMPYSGPSIPRSMERSMESPHSLSPKIHTPYHLSPNGGAVVEHFGHDDIRGGGMPYSNIASVKREEHTRSPNSQQRQPQTHHIPMPSASQIINTITMKHEEEEDNLSPLQSMQSMQQPMQSMQQPMQSMQPLQPMQPQSLGPMAIPQLPPRESIHHPLDIPQQSQHMVGGVGADTERQQHEFTYMPIPTNSADRDPDNFHFHNDPFSTGLQD